MRIWLVWLAAKRARYSFQSFGVCSIATFYATEARQAVLLFIRRIYGAAEVLTALLTDKLFGWIRFWLTSRHFNTPCCVVDSLKALQWGARFREAVLVSG